MQQMRHIEPLPPPLFSPPNRLILKTIRKDDRQIMSTSLTQPTWRERLAAADPALRVHLVGIGGTGLRAIATVLLELGIQVSGSDRAASEGTAILEGKGARVFLGQAAANLDALDSAGSPPDVVLISSAVQPENPEVQAAMARNLPVVKRSEFLPALLAKRKVIAVAGTHGKTTTTAMTVKALREGGIECGYIIGSWLPGYGSGSAGVSEYFVIEADEYDYMFLGTNPTAAVITNVEWDHPDCFPTAAAFKRAFMQFVDLVPREGVVFSCADDAGAEQVRDFHYTRGPKWETYGLGESADLRAVDVTILPNGDTHATVVREDIVRGDIVRGDTVQGEAVLGEITLRVPGMHNLRNAMGAISAAMWCGVPFASAAASVGDYAGSARRFELKGEAGGVTVYDDYAHNPTKVKATLAATRQRFPNRRIWAVVQPHTYSRARMPGNLMAQAFADADEVILVDIYAAREIDDGTISSADIVAASPHPSIRHIGALADAATWVADHIQPGDVLITLGAGDGDKVGTWVLDTLRAREDASGKEKRQ